MGAQLSYGRFNTLDDDAFVSGPLSSTLKARLAIKSVSGDEWQKSYTRNDKLGKLDNIAGRLLLRSEEHTSELQSLMRSSYAVFCLKTKTQHQTRYRRTDTTHCVCPRRPMITT